MKYIISIIISNDNYEFRLEILILESSYSILDIYSVFIVDTNTF